MVSVGIAESFSSCQNDSPYEIESLRDIASWYPEIPESHLHLNESCFTADALTQPVHYISVGGPRGADFQSLFKISVLYVKGDIMAIDFHYHTGEVRRLGHLPNNASMYQTSQFSIDGAEGEIISGLTVELDHRTNERAGRLTSLTVSDHLSEPWHADLTEFTNIL